MRTLGLLALASMLLPMSGRSATVAAMQGNRRVLIVAAPAPGDPQLAIQRRELAGWRQGAADRDISVIELVGASTIGADDPAAMLRRHFALPVKAFAVVLVGKDGHVAIRAAAPLSPRQLKNTIDAMPMRRAGQR